MSINLNSLPTIGNMTGGSGLAAIFDGVDITSGYAQGTVGWAGVDFGPCPQMIDQARLQSASNGFDASGLNSPVRLALYAKNGAAPSGPYDGALLGKCGPFKDVNSIAWHTVYSKDWRTAWRYVWAVVETGVWSVLTELTLHAPQVVCAASERTIITRSANGGILLTVAGEEIDGFRIIAEVPEQAVASVDAKVDIVHRGDLTGYMDAISLGMWGTFRHASTLDGLVSAPQQEMQNAVSGCNLIDRHPQHYEKLHLVASQQLQPGFYQFGLRMNAATDAAGHTNTDGLAAILQEYGRGLNRLRVVIDKAATLHHV